MIEELSLRQLSYFVSASDAGSITAASAELHVSQSAVSLGLADLERLLGVQLVLRQRARGLTLTAAGRELIGPARALLRLAEELRTDAGELGNALRGRLVVGCFQTISPFVLPHLLDSFSAAHPGVELDFVEGSLVDLQAMLADGRCEVALLYDQDLPAAVPRETVYLTRPHVLLAPTHPLARRPTIALHELAGHDMIMLDFPPSLHHFTSLLTAAGVAPRIRHRSVNFETVRSLVARERGFSLLIQRPLVEVSYEGRPLVTRPVADEVEPTAVVLAWPQSPSTDRSARPTRPTRRARAFADHCHRALRDPG
ncbi:LysR family transcriptional regulator [Pseudonocardia eucalypti]|uniref:LysR family transcriptional regulator n=1 Tax=Pseudonocardia eucalypti TaxID=648755 RepID=A0ABP9PDN2_9PSEU|nr:DNA-binding transcriptional LysR family regulator [Pseudonocardia eucalypti]